MFFSPLDQFEISFLEINYRNFFGIDSVILISPFLFTSLASLFGASLAAPALSLAADEPGVDGVGFSAYLASFGTVTYSGFRRQIPLDYQTLFPVLGFLYVLVLLINLVNLFPGAVPQTSWLYGNLLFSITVFFTACFNLIRKNGFGFFNLFLPSGAPGVLVPFIFIIEIISFFIRPFSMAIRLFANIVAGHILLHILAGAVAFLAGVGLFFLPALFSVLGVSVIFSLEILVAFLQAYVFFTLATMYLGESVLPIQH